MCYMNLSYRYMRLKYFLPLILVFLTGTACAQPASSLQVEVGISPELAPRMFPHGRLILFVSKVNRPEPRQQTWPRYPNFVYGMNISGWMPAMTQLIGPDTPTAMSRARGLDELTPGTYFVQALWDQDTLESQVSAPGNLYSDMVEVHLTGKQTVALTLEAEIPPREHLDHRWVEYVDMTSDTLSAWWGKPMHVKAAVLLPSTYYEAPDRTYPVIYNVAGYGGRYTRVNRLMEEGSDFAQWWTSGKAPQIITVFLDGEGPLGDSYQLNSANSGPYGAALTEELIPLVEKTYRGMEDPMYRFLDGCSTGGWVSLALQLFYPRHFNGTWSYSPDPVDFRHMQLVNVYEDENAFVNSFGYERPSMRQTNGEPVFSIRQEISMENVMGRSNSYTTSGEQWGAWNALYSPKGADGLPLPVFDPLSGAVDSAVASHWQQYDLRKYVEDNWATLGPQWAGKIYVWMGDMDEFYLNNALRAFDAMLKGMKDPVSDAQIMFSPEQGHCDAFDHREVLMKVEDKVRKLQGQ